MIFIKVSCCLRLSYMHQKLQRIGSFLVIFITLLAIRSGWVKRTREIKGSCGYTILSYHVICLLSRIVILFGFNTSFFDHYRLGKSVGIAQTTRLCFTFWFITCTDFYQVIIYSNYILRLTTNNGCSNISLRQRNGRNAKFPI